MKKQDEGIKSRILAESVRLFSQKGFHGTSMRDIASNAGCSLPMLYYYYKNKDELFYEVAYNEFILLIERLNKEVIIGSTIKETYFNAVVQRKELTSYDKAIYRLSLKVWLGFDDDSKVRKDLIIWENARIERTGKILNQHFSNHADPAVISNLLVRVIENMIEKIILLDEDIPDETVRKEIDFLFDKFV